MTEVSPGAPKATANPIVVEAGHTRARPSIRPVPKNIKNPEYVDTLANLHVELLKVQRHIKESGERVLLIFEGRDAGGKGGTMKRFIEPLNPRGIRVVALDKPSDIERTQWYFQRYIVHLPHAGEMVFFDRSWYNRAGVERVMGFCSMEQTREFLRSGPEVERMLTIAGIKIFKFYFSVSKEEQLYRFNRRLTNPLKQWKLSPVDKESQDRWDDYTKAKEDMFYYTSTAWAPWTIVKSDNKKRARLEAIRYFLSKMDYPDKDASLMAYDPDIIRTVGEDCNFQEG